MRAYLRDDVSDGDLTRNIAASGRGESGATAHFLADIAEFDARKLYVPAGHPSMHSYLVHVLNQSDDAAYKRIQVARKAREFPALFEALAGGRLHLVGARLLAPYLTSANVSDLLALAARKTCHQIEEMLAQRFPRTEAMPLVMATPSTAKSVATAVGNVQEVSCILATRQVPSPSKVEPIAPERFTMRLSMGRRLRDKLQYAQELASHIVAPGDYEGLLEQMADAFIAKQEKRKFAATDKPRSKPRSATAARTIPAAVRRAVWKRDGGRCTYCNDNERCPARTRIEYDHIVPVARGGESTVENIRLRCHAHNQYAAEQDFGAGFMEQKRKEARAAHEQRRVVSQQEQIAASGSRAGEKVETDDKDVVPWLRQLGFRADESREAAKLCDGIPDATLEQRVRRALSYFRPRLEHRSNVMSRGGM